MKSYRVIYGTQFDAKRDEYIPLAFHMTFYAKDTDVLRFLMIASGCPSGRVFKARDVIEATEGDTEPGWVEPSAN